MSKTYAPNEYHVYVSSEDRERFDDYEGALVKELSGYLLEHARLEKLALLSRPTSHSTPTSACLWESSASRPAWSIRPTRRRPSPNRATSGTP